MMSIVLDRLFHYSSDVYDDEKVGHFPALHYYLLEKSRLLHFYFCQEKIRFLTKNMNQRINVTLIQCVIKNRQETGVCTIYCRS